MQTAKTNNTLSISSLYAFALTVLMLGGLFVFNLVYYPEPADAEPYHAEVREVLDYVPARITVKWPERILNRLDVGENPAVHRQTRQEGYSYEDRQTLRAAIELLRPNRIINRVYTSGLTGRSFTLLIVHCKQARDLAGHYPPRCYPGNGMVQAAPPENWDYRLSSDIMIQGTIYTFRQRSIRAGMRTDQDLENDPRLKLSVYNFMVMPDGQIHRDMDAVYEVAYNQTRKFFGAGQIQIVIHHAHYPEREQRDALAETVVRDLRRQIEVMTQGIDL